MESIVDLKPFTSIGLDGPDIPINNLMTSKFLGLGLFVVAAGVLLITVYLQSHV